MVRLGHKPLKLPFCCNPASTSSPWINYGTEIGKKITMREGHLVVWGVVSVVVVVVVVVVLVVVVVVVVAVVVVVVLLGVLLVVVVVVALLRVVGVEVKTTRSKG